MGIGDFLAGAGDVSRGMRNAEQQEHLARMRQQAVQEENRRVAERREAGRAGIAVGDTPIEVPSFIGQGAGTAAPIGPASGPGKLTPEQLAQARQNLPPDDYAVLAYGQSAATPAPPHAGVATPGQQPAQPTAQPTTEQRPTAPAPQPLAGLAAPADGSFKPVLRGDDATAMQQQLTAEGFPMTPGQGQVLPDNRPRQLISPANTGITEEQLAAMSPQERAQVLQAENDYRDFTRGFGQVTVGPAASVTDLALAPVKFGYNSLAALGNLIGLPQLARAFGVTSRDSGDIPYFTEPYQYASRVKEWGNRRKPLNDEQMRGRPDKPAEEQKAVEAEIKDVPKGPAGTALQGQGRAGVSESKGKAAEPVSPSAFYESNTKSLLADRHRLDSDYQRMREVLLKRAQAAGRYGNVENLQQLEMSVAMLDEQYKTNAMMLEGMAAVKMFEYNDDPSTLGQVMSHYLDGTPVGFNRRDDGQWDLFIGEGNYNGTYSKGDISHMVKQFIDVNYRETTAASMSEAAMKTLEYQLKTNLAISTVEAETLKAMIVEGIRGQNMLMVAKQSGGRYSLGQTMDGELYLYEHGTNNMLLIDPQSGQTIKTPAGDVQIPAAVRDTPLFQR